MVSTRSSNVDTELPPDEISEEMTPSEETDFDGCGDEIPSMEGDVRPLDLQHPDWANRSLEVSAIIRQTTRWTRDMVFEDNQQMRRSLHTLESLLREQMRRSPPPWDANDGTAEDSFRVPLQSRDDMPESDRPWYDVLAALHRRIPVIYPMDAGTLDLIRELYPSPDAAMHHLGIALCAAGACMRPDRGGATVGCSKCHRYYHHECHSEENCKATASPKPANNTPPLFGSIKEDASKWHTTTPESERCAGCQLWDSSDPNDQIVTCKGTGCSTTTGHMPTQYHQSCVDPPIHPHEIENWWCERYGCIAPEDTTVAASDQKAKRKPRTRERSDAPTRQWPVRRMPRNLALRDDERGKPVVRAANGFWEEWARRGSTTRGAAGEEDKAVDHCETKVVIPYESWREHRPQPVAHPWDVYFQSAGAGDGSAAAPLTAAAGRRTGAEDKSKTGGETKASDKPTSDNEEATIDGSKTRDKPKTDGKAKADGKSKLDDKSETADRSKTGKSKTAHDAKYGDKPKTDGKSMSNKRAKADNEQKRTDNSRKAGPAKSAAEEDEVSEGPEETEEESHKKRRDSKRKRGGTGKSASSHAENLSSSSGSESNDDQPKRKKGKSEKRQESRR
ncbi:hypothetical protein NA57DRAFT_58998 [Rhizodiscina lignyota]|uniref:Uncharacterized protein n=1 Tax=Rhizodiscina lignyota TaxID=1504668 RepID=A0A9P4IAN9_9PEZI|nr:hypothetical protein NA57DRAFT_58998 [Rhizodiscina lignyota]